MLAPSDSPQATAFLKARQNVDRSACNRWLQEQNVDQGDEDAVEQAKERWHELPLLADAALKMLARHAIGSALGPLVEPATPFPASIWYGGATDTYAGFHFKGTISDFVTHVLLARAQEIAEKRQGWVVTPTTTTDGHRVNSSTASIHALNLDSDGRGSWDKLVAVLNQLGLAYVAYQSGGWSASTPKWHILLPLSKPFDTSTPDKITRWKSAYNHARVVLGSLAELTGEGFDPTVETPCIPIFITERRSPEDPPRQVISRYGHSLDMVALVAALPEVHEEEQRAARPTTQAAAVPLDDARLEAIVTALVAPTSKILSGRRDLYLALPGALLDRGIAPNDVRAIVEEVSERCPGDPRYTRSEVASKHREHVHCCETTIDRWERQDIYTRIGTLNASWPAVANAIDEALPDPMLEIFRKRLESRNPTVSPSGTASVPNVPGVRAVGAPLDLNDLRKQLGRLRNRKKHSKDIHQQIRGVILGALLDGEDLVPYRVDDDGSKSFVKDASGEYIDRDRALFAALGMISYKLPLGTSFEAVREILRPSLFAMLKEGETLDALMRQAERSFLRATKKRSDSEDRERTALIAADKGLEEQIAIARRANT